MLKSQHICSRGCNGDLHGELVSNPPNGVLQLQTLQSWLDARELQGKEIEVFIQGGNKKYMAIFWIE